MCSDAQSCLTLWDPLNYSPPGPSVHRILLARILEWVTISFSRGSSWPRDQTLHLLKSSALQVYSLPLSHQGSPWSEDFVVVQSISYVRIFATPWTVARLAPLSFTISQSLLKLMSIESVMLSNHLILCCPLLLLPSIFPSIKVFSNKLTLSITWPKY